MIRILVHGCVVLFLTIVTQIGGVAWLLALAVKRFWRSRFSFVVSFLLLYGAVSLGATQLAPLAGRVPLPCFGVQTAAIELQSPLYCVLNRHYVRPPVRTMLIALGKHMDAAYPGTRTLVLDANFPFLDGFPLIPHLSHDDGRKVDLAFLYQSDGAYLAGRTRSPIGYFAFEQPGGGDRQPCAGRNDGLTLRWDLDWLQGLFPRWPLDEQRNAEMLRWLARDGANYGVTRLFIEPHLADRLNVQSPLIRFQGCQAARHDDHIHVEVRGRAS